MLQSYIKLVISNNINTKPFVQLDQKEQQKISFKAEEKNIKNISKKFKLILKI